MPGTNDKHCDLTPTAYELFRVLYERESCLKRFSPIYLHLALDLRWKNLTTRQIFTLSDGLSLQIMATIHKQALKLFSCCEL